MKCFETYFRRLCQVTGQWMKCVSACTFNFTSLSTVFQHPIDILVLMYWFYWLHSIIISELNIINHDLFPHLIWITIVHMFISLKYVWHWMFCIIYYFTITIALLIKIFLGRPEDNKIKTLYEFSLFGIYLMIYIQLFQWSWNSCYDLKFEKKKKTSIPVLRECMN